MELGLPRKYLQRRFISSGISPHEIHRRSTRFLTILKQQKHCQLRGQRGDEMIESFQIPKILQAENRHTRLLICKHNILHEEERMISKANPWAQRVELQTTEDCSQTWEPNVCPAGFWSCLGLVTPLLFPLSPLLNYLHMLSYIYHSIWGAGK